MKTILSILLVSLGVTACEGLSVEREYPQNQKYKHLDKHKKQTNDSSHPSVKTK